ncbi:restriction endonuclease subunit S [Vibrio parahaemolyticus]|uniref:restriction endonuclease subunit S n=1 Tax=Vibrio parahaemolyticus TaxID=670 RepID=UPI00146F04C3|nr:restriction endonuclease subunit S [Vibrio parahaemolyticus]MDF5092207.1 restriction endonuclease subunit S [Vibrio parahaemolyticus]MDF5136508.1 restriction endonuclease subunit S [Vibrio parahaemolyticus]NMU21391.1 restriction endonuclease subunit S [Vibrio parahaemolyticus]NMU56217.1 restriction endonuclease subunit S [Vibrio parahaemolyticus]
MRSNYKKLGQFIKEVSVKNKDLSVELLLGVSITKQFIPSIANTVGTDMSKYKVVEHHQFAYGPVTSRNGEKISVALLGEEKCIVSTSYTVFEIVDTELLDPEYLMMWFRRSEFDRYARYMSHGTVRELFGWQEMCDVELPVPSIEKQREIVREYNVMNDRIALNEQLTQKLEDTAQAIYKQWFVDFSIPDESIVLAETKNLDFPIIPEGWEIKRIDELANKIGSGSTPRGGKGAYKSQGISLIRSMNVHDYQFVYEDLAFIDDVQAKKLANVEIEPRDVLINITGVSVARCCVVPNSVLPARVNQHVMIIRPNLDMSYYLQCALASSSYKSRLLGTSEGASTRQALTKADIEEFLVLVPSKSVLAKFEGIAEVIFSKIEALAQTSQKLKELRAIVLSRLATV